MLETLTAHWAEYLIEGTLLAAFMVAACVAVIIVQHPRSPVANAIRGGLTRRAVIGVLMGLTAITLIYSPWGQRSGAHLNPATTLTFLALGKVQPWDAAFYVAAQFVGAIAGMGLARLVLGHLVSHESVNHVATLPGTRGPLAAWIAEFVIAFGMMSMVLWSTNHAATAPFTGLFAGILIAVYIAVEAPLSGMSMNPARTLGSALWARLYRGLWIYLTAPLLAMLCAAATYVTVAGSECVHCAKLHHSSNTPCIFRCRFEQLSGSESQLPHTLGIKHGQQVVQPNVLAP